MRIIVLVLMLFVAGSLFGQEEFDYETLTNSKLLLVKQDKGKTVLIFQSLVQENILYIYDFVDKDSIKIKELIQMKYFLRDSAELIDILSLDYVNESLYLGAFVSKMNSQGENKYLNYLYIYEPGILTTSLMYGNIIDIKMIDDSLGCLIQQLVLTSTTGKWSNIKIHYDDTTYYTWKIIDFKSLEEVVICERDYGNNLINFCEYDFNTFEKNHSYKNPIDNEKHKDYYKPHSFKINDNNEVLISYEYINDGGDVQFEIAKTRDKGENWEILYVSNLTERTSYGEWEIKLHKINKLDVFEDKILAVNFEQILYSDDNGASWKVFDYKFSTEAGTNLFPMFIDGEPIIFTETSVVTIDLNSNSVIEMPLKIYPNPAKDKVRVSFEAFGNENLSNIKLELVNISSGESYSITNYNVINKDEEGIEIELNVKNYIPGAYLLKLSNGNISNVEKLIIE